jgi:ArsR family transcriptional regulator, arsenate/arsenite/antimonite-responsive transcriptional repressor
VNRQQMNCYRKSTMNDGSPIAACCDAPPDLPLLSSEEGEAALASLAKALGHPVRVRIVRLLLARDACVCGELVEELPLAQATVSQHLKVLREAGLIQGDIDGPRVCYCVDRTRLMALQGLVGELCEVTSDRANHATMEAS